ncbi:hypothetical protein C922_02146 [Plasmodium inui San Antonio 1]|uniref:protein-serine/threonine phosphatase n=1 Tax=Plasmodium inui San Antonio 1 TaxID=1237626 RepID=W7A6N4_9APIC|nr:hypothetical protein C922_02146 [Plasmodium inui San Antonio 1]EUD67440.1 hypothetical protein C922_02146 [Plasmodium inui San Antonio 1]
MDTGKIFLPPNIALPCKLKWAVDNNSIVSSNQIIAFLIETGNDRIDAERTGESHTQRPLIGQWPTDEGSSERRNFHLGSNEADVTPYGKSKNGEEGATRLATQNDNNCENTLTNVCEEIRSSVGDHYTENLLRRDSVDGVASQGTFPDRETSTDTGDNLDVGNNQSEERRNESTNEKNNFINLILNNKNNCDIKKNSYVTLRSSSYGRIRIIKQNPFSEKDEYIHINSPNELLCEISDERCNHEVIFSGLCTNCFLNQEEINKNKEEQKYFLSPGFLTNEKELYINTDKVIDLEKERISNIIKNRKLCLVLDLDNTLLHASFFVISININSDVINITTDIDEELEGELGCAGGGDKDGGKCSGNGGGGKEDPIDHRIHYRSGNGNPPCSARLRDATISPHCVTDFPFEENCDSLEGGARNSKKEDNVEVEDETRGINVHGEEALPHGVQEFDAGGGPDGDGDCDGDEDCNGDNDCDDMLSPEMNQDEMYSIFCQKKNNGMDDMNKYQDIKSSYENYCDFLAKMNTINLLKHNGKFIHYENLKDKNIKKKIDKLEHSVLKTNVKHHKGSYTIYYKLRPGVIQFLQTMNRKYEIYLYTMGTLEHAKSCLLLLDPLKKFFGNRVFSRKDSVNGLKHLNRILPTYRSVSLCIDDSDYMWKESSSCIKVHGYNYFPEINFLEDIKRKPYFLTKFFAMAQSYLNFSSNLYGFINFKCSEYERMRIHRFRSVLYSECTSWGVPYNGSMALGGACQMVDQGCAEEGEDDLCEGEKLGPISGVAIGVAIGVSTGVATGVATGIPSRTSRGDSSQLSVYHFKAESTSVKEEREDALAVRRGNSLSGNSDSSNEDELDESFEDNFIDLDKEFETDSEEGDISVMDPKIESNSCNLNLQNGLEFLDDTQDYTKEKEVPMQHFSGEHVESTFIVGTKKGIVKRDHLSNFYPNDDTPDRVNNPNLFYMEKPTEENINNNFSPQSDNNFFVNAEGLNGRSPTSSVPLNDRSCAADLTSERFIPFEDEIIYKFISERNFRKYDNYVVGFLRSYFKGGRLTRGGEGKQEGFAEGDASADNSIGAEVGPQIGAGVDAEVDANVDAEVDADVDGEIDTEPYADIDADVGDDEEGLAVGGETVRENPHRRHREGKGDKEIKTEREDQQLYRGGRFRGEASSTQNTIKRVEKKIKKTKVKKLIHFGNLRKRKSTDLRTVNKSDDPSQPPPSTGRDSDQNLGKDGASNQNEYYESFCIPKNFNEGNYKDNDKQLHYLTAILDEIHHIFYKIFEHFKIHKTNERNEEDQIYNYFLRYPIVRTILIEFRRHVLKDCTFNVSQLSDEIRRSDFMDHILKLGGTINNENYTHILTVNNFIKNENWKDAKVTNLMWIERALYTWTKVDTKHYDMSSWDKMHRNFWDVIEYEEKKKKKMKSSVSK